MTENWILVVEDEPDIRLFTRVLFEEAGYLVAEAQSAEAAYRLWQRLKPDVIVADHRLGAERGLGLLHRVREECPDQVAVLISAVDDERVQEAARNLGVPFVIKQNCDELPCLVEDLLNPPALVGVAG